MAGHRIGAEPAGTFEAIPALTAEDVADLIDWTTGRRRESNQSRAVHVPTRPA
ncbi:hypothetical protein GCM10009665_12720 [Kitasatospora nipponensis]|uniref:Cytochrome c n=1 Tax=Kitasatospora nipponensis TaxID=258049 RepID=A0ABN1VUL8_9ACTN